MIAALRQGYAHDRSATAPPGCTDVVAEFLLRSDRGPDYLFASSAAVLLRSLGYPTRVVSGLYAAPGRYDPRTRHTPVTGEDVHFWAEVRLPNGHLGRRRAHPRLRADAPGSPLVRTDCPGALRPPGGGREATPPGCWPPWSASGSWSSGAATCSIGWRRSRSASISGHDPRRCVMRALKLIERRARWAGRPRPPGLTLARWYVPVARRSAGRAPGRPRRARPPGRLGDPRPRPVGPARARERSDIQQTCRSAVRAWTLARFRHAIPSQLRKAATT